jgi:hypothetical protein
MTQRTEWLDRAIWGSIQRLSKRARRRHLAVAYVSSDTHLRLRRGDILIVNASQGAIRSGQTSAAVLASAFARGVLIYSHPTLHAKVYLFDSEVVIGSANLSGTSRGLTEACVQSTDMRVIRNARSWFEKTKSRASRLSRPAIGKLLAMPVIRRGGLRNRKPTLLEAFEMQLPLLEDLTFGIYTDPPKLSATSVQREAKRRNIPLPRRSTAWIWFEDEYSRNAERLTRRLLADRPMIALYGHSQAGKLTDIDEVDQALFSFIECYKLGSTLVSVFDLRKRPPVRLGGSDTQRFCRLLSLGLTAQPRRAKAWHGADCGLLLSKSLVKVLRAGQADM